MESIRIRRQKSVLVFRSFEVCWESTQRKRSQNYYKIKKKIALCYEKITNTRKDYLHKMSHEIISENQVIVSEDK
ncbi:MAG: transposase [Clostridium sp.]